MPVSEKCNKKCLELIRSDKSSDNNSGLKQLQQCFKKKAYTRLSIRGVYNDLDKSDIFNRFLEKINKYPPKNNCSEGLFYYSLEQRRASFFNEHKKHPVNYEQMDYTTGKINNAEDYTRLADFNTIEEADCLLTVFNYMKKNYPSDFEFAYLEIYNKSNLIDFARTLFIGHGAVRQRKSKAMRIFYEIKRELCDEA